MNLKVALEQGEVVSGVDVVILEEPTAWNYLALDGKTW